MEVILLQTVRNLGALGDKVKVKPGFARNFLIPQSKAVFASKINIEKFEQRRAELEKLAAEKHAKALERQALLNKAETLVITAKVGDEGKLFGSISMRDVAAALAAAGIQVEKSEIVMPQGGYRLAGDYDITIELDSDVTATIKLSITASA